MTKHAAFVAETANNSSAFGNLLREWRAHRGISQHALSLDADISQRHISFIESGRATPSREMIGRISDVMDLPLRARNDLMVAAGFAPTYQERTLNQSDMSGIRDILTRILQHHEPYPAMVLDRSWNFMMRNEANRRIIATCLDGRDASEVVGGEPVNFLRLMFAENGLRPRVRNWNEVSAGLLARLRRESRAHPGSPSVSLYRELAPTVRSITDARGGMSAVAPTIPLELDLGNGKLLRLTNTLTTFGTPQDVNVQELRVEMSFPVDDASDRLLRGWVE